MKKIFRLCFFVILAISLIVLSMVPVFAQESFEKIHKPLSPETGSDVHSIPIGSVIYHLNNGVTRVFGPDKALFLSALDEESDLIATPAGKLPATHVHHVPSGAFIDVTGNISDVYSDGVRVLTVIDQAGGGIPGTLSSFHGWIEWAEDLSVSNLDYFHARWNVPSDPPNPNYYDLVYLFHGIQPSGGGKIIQPVLEWNYLHSDRWTGAAWYVNAGTGYRSSGVNATTGNEIRGTMSHNGYNWTIQFSNHTTGSWTSINTNIIGTSNLETYVTLEGLWVYDDGDDLPGDTNFNNMSFFYGANSVDIDWYEQEPGGSLNVVVNSDFNVTLETAN